ncbi:DUF131 domain-containing protein [Methanolobus sp. ZRKC5]|uniref:TIGR00304 family membrane protein n=1 Tax=unclassified Methanolobus TaxID=2629569 RepID=UPI00313D7621
MIGSYLVFIGMLMLISGFFLVVVASFYGGENSKRGDEYTSIPDNHNSRTSSPSIGQESIPNKSDVRGGGIIMLGPIPIIFGSDSKNTSTMVVLAIVLMVLYFLIFM